MLREEGGRERGGEKVQWGEGREAIRLLGVRPGVLEETITSSEPGIYLKSQFLV